MMMVEKIIKIFHIFNFLCDRYSLKNFNPFCRASSCSPKKKYQNIRLVCLATAIMQQNNKKKQQSLLR